MIKEKKKLLEKLLKKIHIMKKHYLKKTNKYKKYVTTSDVIIVGSGTIATTSLILSFSIVASPLAIVSLVSSSVSTLGSAIQRSSKIKTKYEFCKSAYLSFADLERDLKLKLTMSLDENSLDLIISDISDRIGLIEANAPIVSVSSEENGSIEPMMSV
jgi:hypothetical protein